MPADPKLSQLLRPLPMTDLRFSNTSPLPRTVAAMRKHLGTIEGWNGLKKASGTFSNWLIDAAEERWPSPWDPELDWEEKIWANAVERWGEDIKALRDDLLQAELYLLRYAGAVA